MGSFGISWSRRFSGETIVVRQGAAAKPEARWSDENIPLRLHYNLAVQVPSR
jgi:hypothetical protein